MRTPTQPELQKMLAQIHPRSPFGGRDRAMLLLAANTGLRVSELVSLNVHHVANQQGHAREWLQLPAEIAAKSHRERLIPLNKRARLAVVEVLTFNRQRGFSTAAEAPLFVNRKHKRLSTRP
ncbi:MAG: tyrosine-type recombinase/integrase [Armatimonadetes bacterium]|nr:tyrosine-type recombinase/integrase [Armatimonadota bacterium]